MKSRTSRGFDGTATTGKKLADLAAEWMGKKGGDAAEDVFRAWLEAVGEKMAPLTEPVSWQNGVLTVKVKSSTLYSLLCQHEKVRLLSQLQQKFSIRDLKFRIG